MTKKEFAKLLIETIDNARDIDHKSNDEIVDELSGLLDVLQPKDRESFSKWGYPVQKSTPADCYK